ncbi:MAG: hypothetical protein WKG06_12595 [Segetibacter sp.]
MNTIIYSKNNEKCDISCRLTSSELRKRKLTVIAELVIEMNQTEEMDNGYCYSFSYSEELLFKLAEFIKLEKECCPFFNFNLSISGNSNTITLSLTGVEGTKEFIKYELEMF